MANRIEKPPIVQKQPAEKFDVGADFATDLASGETIVLDSSSVIASTTHGSDVTEAIIVANSLTLAGTQLSAWVQGGTVAERYYKVSFRAVTDQGRTF